MDIFDDTLPDKSIYVTQLAKSLGIHPSYFTIHLITLGNHGYMQKRIVKLIDYTIASHTTTKTGMTYQLGSIAWSRVFSELLNLISNKPCNFGGTLHKRNCDLSAIAVNLTLRTPHATE